MKQTLFAIIALLLIVFQTNYAQTKTTPRTISFQGVLTDTANHPYPNGKYQFVFRFFDSESGGNLLWESTPPESLQTENGTFSTQLGKNPPFSNSLKFDTQYWLSLQVNGIQMPKRMELTSVGRSISSGYSDSSIHSLYSDTARFAKSTTPQQYADSARISGTVPNNSITSSKILDGTIQTVDVASNFKAPFATTADTALHTPSTSLSENSVTSFHIQDGTIKGIDIENLTITTSKIDTASVTNSKIANGSITTEKIADGATTTNKIADNAINSFKLQSASVTADKILDSNITSSKIGRNAIGKNHIQDNAIETRHLSPTIKIPNADSISHIAASTQQEPFTLYPLNEVGGITLSSNPGLHNKRSTLQTRTSFFKILKDVNECLIDLVPGGSALQCGINKGLEVIGAIDIGISTYGYTYGVEASSSNGGTALYAHTNSGLAGKFDGNVKVNGDLTFTGSLSGSITASYANDADKLDGYHSSDFAFSSHNHFGSVWSGSGIGLTITSNNDYGILGQTSTGHGVRGYSNSSGYGVSGYSYSAYGGYFETGTTQQFALVARSNGGSSGANAFYATGYARIDGNLSIGGTISKGGGSFKIDHPLDPENKYLYHSFVESPDMKNIYDGVITLDEKGEANVELPTYFETLNKDFRYQLTCIGGYSQVYIAEEITDNHFKISGGKSGMKVSWQVTGIRKDAFAEKHRIIPEVEKEQENKGKYLYPKELGKSEEFGIEYQRIKKMESTPQQKEKSKYE
jgi:hypothetical protein